MNLTDFIQVLQIFKKYYKNPNGFHVSAEHDMVCLAPTDKPLSKVDIQAVEDLGAYQEYVKEGSYDPNESWVVNI